MGLDLYECGVIAFLSFLEQLSTTTCKILLACTWHAYVARIRVYVPCTYWLGY